MAGVGCDAPQRAEEEVEGVLTTLANDKALKRQTAVRVRGRLLNVELHDRYVEVWRSGTRVERVSVDWESVFSLGLKRLAAARGASVPRPARGKRRYRAAA